MSADRAQDEKVKAKQEQAPAAAAAAASAAAAAAAAASAAAAAAPAAAPAAAAAAAAAASGEKPLLQLPQLGEKEMQIVVQQLIALSIRKNDPQGAGAIPKAKEEAAGPASSESASSPAAPQGLDPQLPSAAKGNGKGKTDRRKYDRRGRLLSNGVDLCDCLNVECLGCFYPCPKCSSKKCGVKCRRNRRWVYRKTENESGDLVNTFPFDYPD